MPVSGRAGGGSVRIRGGERLEKFILGATDPATRTQIAGAAARVMRRRILPTIRARSPERTGTLKRSLKIQNEGPSVQLRGVWYAQLVRWDGGQKSVATEAMNAIASQRFIIRREIAAEIRRLA